VFQTSLCEHHFQSSQYHTVFTKAFSVHHSMVRYAFPISGYGYGGYNYGNWGDYTHPGYSTQPQEPALRCKHRINMEVDLQNLFGLHVTCCAQLYSLAVTPQSPPHLDSYTRALLPIGQQRQTTSLCNPLDVSFPSGNKYQIKLEI
jgi:hypothetical protein